MPRKLNNSKEYIEYIRAQVERKFPIWKEANETLYTNQINKYFTINFIANIDGYVDSVYEVSFVNDRGNLELFVNRNNKQIHLGYLVYNHLVEAKELKELSWKTSLCIEVIDAYLDFLAKFFTKS